MGLKSQLNSGIDPDPVPVFMLQLVDRLYISVYIQGKIILAESGVVVVVVRNTDLLHAKGDGAFNLQPYRRIRIAGKFGVEVAVTYHKDPLSVQENIHHSYYNK